MEQTSLFDPSKIKIDLSLYSPRYVDTTTRILEVYEGKEMYYYATLKIDVKILDFRDWRESLTSRLIKICPGIVKDKPERFIITNPKPYTD